MTITYGSVCSGIEAATVAWHSLGFKPSWFSEIELFPSALLAHHYPTVPNLGDMTKIAGWVRAGIVDAPDVLVGGTPCFVAGHMVLCERGYVPIQDVVAGDRVVSHLGRLQTVLRVGSEVKPVGMLKAVGMPEGVTCTADHPFLSHVWSSKAVGRGAAYRRQTFTGPAEWMAASSMPGRQYVALNSYATVGAMASPTVRLSDTQAMQMAGWYLGDGWPRRFSKSAKKNLMLGINEAKYLKFIEAFPGVGHTVDRTGPTGVKLAIHDTALVNWLVSNFGEGAAGKRVPAWALSDPNRAGILEGYLATDGHCDGDGKFTANSVSRALSFGIRDLAQTLGYVGSVEFRKTPDTTTICGRTVNQQDYWSLRIYREDRSRKSRSFGNHLLRTVQSWTPSNDAAVYNIEVENDNSYVLDGVVVHNCQAFSIAGVRAGLLDPRGQLTLAYADLLDAIDEKRTGNECVAVWENVPGVLSDKTNAFGCFLAILAGEDIELQPPGGKWPNAGYVAGPKRTIAWRVLDAQYFGVAQRRRRVFLVASAREGFDPAAVLFELDGVRRDTAPSRETREEVTGTISSRTTGGGGLQPVAFGGNNQSGPIEIATARNACGSASGRLDFETETFLVQPALSVALRGRDGGATAELGDDVAGCLRASGGGGDKAHVLAPIAFSSKDYGGDACVNLSPTLRAGGHTTSHANAGNPPAIAFDSRQDCVSSPHVFGALGSSSPQAQAVTYRDAMGLEHWADDPVCVTGTVTHCLKAEGFDASEDGTGRGQPIVAVTPIDMRQASRGATMTNNRKEGTSGGAPGTGIGQVGDPAPTISTCHVAAVHVGMAVRRLTPRECERLQGFEDDYTAVPFGRVIRPEKLEQDWAKYMQRGGVMTIEQVCAAAADGPRYKSLGNSMAVPCMRWIGFRLMLNLLLTRSSVSAHTTQNQGTPS